MIFEQYLELGLSNFTYLIGDEKMGQAAVVDPTASSVEAVQELLGKRSLTLKYIILTHTHFDHTGGLKPLAAKNMNAETVVHKLEVVSLKRMDVRIGVEVDDGNILKVGRVPLKVIHTPGHSPGSICILVQNQLLLTGDTLFIGRCGRTDLPGGSPEAMFRSLSRRIKTLPEKIKVYPGHNYSNRNSSTIREEKETNIALKPNSFEEFDRII
ncbi:MBL fold metallo-hydrolase [candidate division KSB1 bacterium]